MSDPVVKTLNELHNMKELILLSDVKFIQEFYIHLLPHRAYMRIPSSRFGKTRTRECMAILGFCKAYGECYLIIPEISFSKAMRVAKDNSKKKPLGIWVKKYPYVKLQLRFINKHNYEVIILNKWEIDTVFKRDINRMKEEMF